MADTTTMSSGSTTPSNGTSTQGLSPWASTYVTDTLSLANAAGTEPLENTIYGGQLTAGASDIQNQVFNGIGSLNFPSNLGQSFTNTGAPTLPALTGTGLNTGYTPGSGGINYFGGVTDPMDLSGRTQTNAGITSLSPGTTGSGTTGSGTTGSGTTGSGTNNMSMAAQYMNPYLQSVLNPQLQQLRDSAQSKMNEQMGKLTSQGAYGGGRQAVMQGAGNRDLMQELNKTVGTGYANAYNKGMDQFNAEQKQGLDLGKFMADQGKEQRAIDSEGTAADVKEFERQRDYYKNNAKYMRDILGPGTLPIQETTNTPAQLSGLASLLSSLGGIDELTTLLTKSGSNLDEFLTKLGF